MRFSARTAGEPKTILGAVLAENGGGGVSDAHVEIALNEPHIYFHVLYIYFQNLYIWEKEKAKIQNVHMESGGRATKVDQAAGGSEAGG